MLFGRRSNSSHYTELCNLLVEARSDVAQWVIVSAKAIKVMAMYAVAEEAADVPLVTKTTLIEVEVVVANATAMSVKLACYSVA